MTPCVGGSIVTFGCCIYPAPAFVYLIAVTSPFVFKSASAVALIPPTGAVLIVTFGATAYEFPDASNIKALRDPSL